MRERKTYKERKTIVLLWHHIRVLKTNESKVGYITSVIVREFWRDARQIMLNIHALNIHEQANLKLSVIDNGGKNTQGTMLLI